MTGYTTRCLCWSAKLFLPDNGERTGRASQEREDVARNAVEELRTDNDSQQKEITETHKGELNAKSRDGREEEWKSFDLEVAKHTSTESELD